MNPGNNQLYSYRSEIKQSCVKNPLRNNRLYHNIKHSPWNQQAKDIRITLLVYHL
jgi:hypothetical protein